MLRRQIINPKPKGQELVGLLLNQHARGDYSAVNGRDETCPFSHVTFSHQDKYLIIAFWTRRRRVYRHGTSLCLPVTT